MQVDFINPFVGAAVHVLEAELGETPVRGQIRLEGSRVTPGEMTVAVGVTGEVEGIVLYGMSESTARRIVAHLLQRNPWGMDEQLVESGAGELANMITGTAGITLESKGYRCDITPPSILIGRGVMISTVEVQRLVIPLKISHGELVIHVALRKRSDEKQGGNQVLADLADRFGAQMH